MTRIKKHQSNVCALAATAVIAAMASQTSSAALIAHYSFDELSGTTATDSTSGANGTISANVTLGTTGKVGTAFTFNNNVNSFVDMGNASSVFDPIIASQQVTISVWLKWTDATQGRDVAVFLGNDASSYNYLDVGTLGTGDAPANAGKVYGRSRVATNTDTFSATGGLNDDQWHHVVYTADATTNEAKIYIDGVLSTTSNPTDLAFPTFNNFEVGRLGRSSPTDAYNGSIDELRIYDTVLTLSEIQALTTVPEPTTALLGSIGVLFLLRRRRA